MVINMDESRLRTIEQIEQFLSASTLVAFSKHAGDIERYEHITRVLKRFDYPQRNKRERGVLLRYLRHTSGYSRPQITRLVAQWRSNRLAAAPLAKRYCAPAAPFARKYTPADVSLLVQMDKAHEDVCGPAVVHLLKRAFKVYGDARYERLAGLSSSHLYNLRKSAGYQRQRASFTKTRPACNPIGVRKAPRAAGRAGFIRVDSVHQGDLDGLKGVYHITCVDEVSQWQVEACVQGISEAFLLPVLELVLAQFPFVIVGFGKTPSQHSDNGSEYINKQVAQMLNKLNIEQTKSRAHATAMTTPWPRARMPAWSGSTWATAISRRSMQNPSMRSSRRCSTHGSICTGPACLQPRWSAQKARSSSAICTRM